jgi:hypothetical protein
VNTPQALELVTKRPWLFRQPTVLLGGLFISRLWRTKIFPVPLKSGLLVTGCDSTVKAKRSKEKRIRTAIIKVGILGI